MLLDRADFCDIRFLVEGKVISGHKLLLSMASPVFRQMFYGDLKEKNEVVTIDDLTAVGFSNALRFVVCVSEFTLITSCNKALH